MGMKTTKMVFALRRAAITGMVAWLGVSARAQYLAEPWLEVVTPTNTVPTGHLWRIAYGNGMWLILAPAVANMVMDAQGMVVTSLDGLNWTRHQMATNSALQGVFNGLTAGNGAFVAAGVLGTNGVVQVSRDGIAWGLPAMFPRVSLNGVSCGGGAYVAVGERGGSSFIAASTNGVSWVSQTWTNYGGLNAVTFGQGTFVAVGKGGAIFTSTNALDWATQSVAVNLDSVGYGDGMFLATAPASYPYLLKSLDGRTWVIPPMTGFEPYFEAAPYGNGLFVVGGAGSTLLVSRNGVDWWVDLVLWHEDWVPLRDMAYGAGKFIMVGDRGILNLTPRYFLSGARTPSGDMGLTVGGGDLERPFRLQAAPDLSTSSWVDLVTLTNTGSPTNWVDPEATNYPRRFYRVVAP